MWVREKQMRARILGDLCFPGLWCGPDCCPDWARRYLAGWEDHVAIEMGSNVVSLQKSAHFKHG